MKKIYMLAAAALLSTGAASADTLTFYLNGQACEPGQQYSVSEYEYYGNDKKGQFTVDPKATLLSDVKGNVTVVAESLTEGQTIQMCAGGMCETGASVTKQATLEANEQFNLQFEFMGSVKEGGEAAIPTILSRLTAGYTGESQTVSITVEMGPKADVKSIIVDDNAFLLTADGIRYDVEGATTAALFDLKGNCVLKADINGQGTLSTANIPAGVYVYSLTGAVNRSGKIYVR